MALQNISAYNFTSISEVLSHYNNDCFETEETHGVLLGIVMVALLRFKNNGNIKWTNTKSFILKAVIWILSYVLFVSLLVTTLAPLYIYRNIIHFILLLRYKSTYKGLLNGQDAVWTYEDNSKSCVVSLLMAKFDSKLERDELFRFAGERIEKMSKQEEFEKFTYTVHKFMGYSYFLKKPLCLSDILKNLNKDKYSSKEKLSETIQEISNVDRLHNNNILWEIHIGEEEIELEGQKIYPLIIRINHCLGDGVSSVDLLSQCVQADDTYMMARTIGKDNIFRKYLSFLKNTFLVSLSLPSYILRNTYKNRDESIVHGKQLSGKRSIFWKIEKYGVYFRAVKALKKKLEVSFMDIVATALSAAITNFMKKNESETDQITAVVTVALVGEIHNTKSFLNNKFTVGTIDLPLINNCDVTMGLHKVKSEVAALKKADDFKINFWLLETAASVVPEFILNPLLNVYEHTMIISNLPGPKKIYFERSSFEDIVFWIPHKAKTGVGFTILTYDDKLQIGLSIDKVFGIKNEHAEAILEDFFKTIETLQKTVAIGYV